MLTKEMFILGSVLLCLDLRGCFLSDLIVFNQPQTTHTEICLINNIKSFTSLPTNHDILATGSNSALFLEFLLGIIIIEV